MCGRLVVSEPDLSVFVDPLDVGHVDAALLDQWQPRFNLAPTQLAPLVTNDLERRLTLAQFGLVPHWTKHTKLRSGRLINARVEGVANSRAFAQALIARRGIVPVTGYFEWLTVAGKRQPIFIHAAHGEPLFLASLWDRWRAADGKVTQSFSVLTRPSIGALVPIHSRMPLTLSTHDVGAWLAPEQRSADQLSRLLQAVPDVERLALRRVSPLANSPRNDGPECIDEADQAAPAVATLETPQLLAL